MENTIDRLKPSRTGELDREVAFFVALRAGDRVEITRLLAIAPELVDAQQEWDSALVLEGVLPFANRATALITAIELDDLPMLELLLDAGADVNGACGCATGESPLWAAALFDRVPHAQCLLERGADPNSASSTGNTPLHLAAMRGHEAMVALLLAHGADPTLRDSGPKYPLLRPAADGRANAGPGGRTAAEWAKANGNVTVAEKLAVASSRHGLEKASGGVVRGLERVAGPGSISKDVSTVFHTGIFHTGIKALDLFVPIPRGGLIRVPFKAGVGMVVLLAELSRRFLATPGGEVLWTGFTQPPFDLGDWEAEMAESGLKDRVHGSLVSFNESPENRREAFRRGIELAEALRDTGKEVLAVVLVTEGFENDVDAGLLRLSAAGAGSITTVVVTDFPETEGDVWAELQAPYSAQIVLDRAKVQAGLLPALDQSLSLSASLTEGSIGERHLRLAEEAKALIADYLLVDPDYEQLDDESGDERQRSAKKMFRFFCQPFYIAEPFTGRPGEWVARHDLLDDIEALLKADG